MPITQTGEPWPGAHRARVEWQGQRTEAEEDLGEAGRVLAQMEPLERPLAILHIGERQVAGHGPIAQQRNPVRRTPRRRPWIS